MYYRLECNRNPNDRWITIRENDNFKGLIPLFERMAYHSIKGNIPIDAIVQINNQFVSFGDIFLEKVPIEEQDLIDSSLFVSDPKHINHKIDKMELVKFLSYVLNSKVYLEFHLVGLVWEYIFEIARQYVDKNLPSRLDSVFFFDNINSAKYYSTKQRQGLGEVYMINVIQEDCAQAFDMNWLDSIPLCATFGDAIKTAIKYWQQETTDNPTMEILFQGQFEIGDIVDSDKSISL